jgi:hypothetical protein
MPVSALGLGALHTPVLALCAALAALGTGLLWFEAEPLEPRPAATALIAVALALIAWTTLQVIPLPIGIVRSIAPESADVWSRALSPLHENGPSLVTLSLDPTASRVQILRGITYLTFFVGALRVARRREGVALLERVLLASAVVVAAAALMHPVLGARKVFGIYEPTQPGSYVGEHHLSPLLNTNHLSAYVNIGAMLAFSCSVERRSTVPRPLAIVIALLLSATTVWTMSRGGTATLILGVVLVTGLSFAARRAKHLRTAGQLAVLATAVGGVAVLILASADEFRTKVAHNDLSKVDLVKNAFAITRDFPIFGVGRGAFESAFPKFRLGSDYVVFTHPENVVAQWITEWGLPLSLVGFGAILWALRPKTALARSRPPVGPWAALVALGIHNLCDFNSEVPGVVVALTACAAMVTGGTGGGSSTPHRTSVWAKRPTAIALLLAGAALAAIVVTLPRASGELYADQRALRDLGLDRSLSRDAFRARIREAMLRHPAEPYFPFVGAVRATMTHDDNVLPWAGRALERSPVYGRVHLLLARSLFAKHQAQARLEYRTACVQDPSSFCTLLEVVPLVDSYDDAMELVPDGIDGARVLAHIARNIAPRLPATVTRLDREITRRDPSLLDPVERTAARALADVRDEEPWCGDAANPSTSLRLACIADGLAAAERLRSFAPEKCEGHALVAELRVATGDIDAGYAELDRSLEQVERRSACARRLVSLAVLIRNNARIDSAIDRMIKLGCETPAECVTNYTFAADVEARRGAQRRALTFAKKASERAPERDDLIVDVATRASAQGSHGDALEAFTRLAERHPNDPRWAESAKQERDAITRALFEQR